MPAGNDRGDEMTSGDRPSAPGTQKPAGAHKQAAAEPVTRWGHEEFAVVLGSLDDSTLNVAATYRPKELQIDQSVPWSKHTNKGSDQRLQLEFSGGEGRTASLELFFDASEIQGGTVEPSLKTLTQLATVRDPESKEDSKKRPHHCILVFGKVHTKHFKCVIESISTKYTMFSPTGEPLRAIANVKLREARFANMAKDEAQDKQLSEEQAQALQAARERAAREAEERSKVPR